MRGWECEAGGVRGWECEARNEAGSVRLGV